VTAENYLLPASLEGRETGGHLPTGEPSAASGPEPVLSTQTPPKVSVCVIAYNQQGYIRQCLQSIVEQQTNFGFELIVGDDCSRDGTRAIIEEFAREHPEIVRVVLQENNTGGVQNYLDVHALARGKYVAHVDGDDYSLPGKLQAQVDFLDANPSCNVVWHPVDTLRADGTLRRWHAVAPKKEALLFDRRDQISFILIGAHSSKMYRTGVRDLMLPQAGFTDFFLNVSHIGDGYGALLRDRSYGVHRVGIGISSSGYLTRRILIDNLDLLFRTEPENRDAVNSAILHLLLSDLKRWSPTLQTSLSLFLRSFSLRGIGTYLRTYKTRRALVL
jgi:glycosyltransferase involved in cell wall biosynthesis